MLQGHGDESMVQASISLELKRTEMEQICVVKRRKSKAMSGDAWELISNDETSTGKDKQANARKRRERK